MNACFFDFDGTLFDTRAGLAAAVNHTRRDLGLEPLAVPDVLAHVGQGARHLLARTVPAGGDGPDGAWERFRVRYAEHALDDVRLYPGVARTLETLAANGWKLGINTAKPRFAVDAILARFGLGRFFGDAVVAGGECAAMKPSAEPLFACAEKMGHALSPDDWMVGDHWTDLGCAENAGVRGAFCAFGFGTRGAAPAAAVLEKMDDFLAVAGLERGAGRREADGQA